MEELITIIVPVYNVEQYVARCLKSIIDQTYRNLEIIVVDDGSTDKSGTICDEIAHSDYRIKVIHKENGGLSDARNVGLEIAKGKYIGFIDSDDYIEPDMIECLHNSCIEHQADISVCGRVCEMEESSQKYNLFSDFSGVLTSNEAIKDLLIQKNCDSAAWDKIYKAELLRDIRYPKGIIHEDLNVTVRLFAQCKRVAFTGRTLYHYRVRNGSICNQKFSDKKFDLYTQSCLVRDFINEDHSALNKEADFFVWRNFMALLYSAKRTENCDKFQIKRLKKILVKESRRALHNPYVTTKNIVKAYKEYYLIKCKSILSAIK